jgi:predicted helicase
MPTDVIPLFYSFAHEDDALRKLLDTHLTLLKRQGVISKWDEQDITAGNPRAETIKKQLAAARIILVLISPDFMASDYCYGVEMQEALHRHAMGTARVIPILLRPCDWEDAPFNMLQVLPRNAKPVVLWDNTDMAFTEIAKEIRKVANELNGNVAAIPTGTQTTSKKTGAKRGEEVGKRHMLSAPALSSLTLKKTIDRYYKELADYQSKADYESGLRGAFQSLLADTARHVKWTLVAEQTIGSGIRPDGVVRDDYFARGYWEAKGPKSDLEREIRKKIADGYPLTNTIFENTRKAVLFQNKKRVIEYDLQKPNDVSDLLKTFFSYTEPDIENFAEAVQEFKERIPDLAKELLSTIDREYKANQRFIAAFDTFTELCRTSLDPKITTDVIKEMLIQHLLTERLFRTIFDNTDFVRRNVIASEVKKVIEKLASRSFNRHEFLKSLDRFYVAIEAAAKGIESWSERQHFLNTVYERFFQGYSVKRADTYGIVYTPQEIVDFMCASVDEVLRREFNTSIEEPGVQILDPATGTGSFIVNLLHRIPPHKLAYKYKHDLFCNEIMLLPYYIASLNIEHEYYAKMGEYEPFEGVCFVDTLELAEGKQLPLFVEENTERVQREKDAQIMVVIGNPPYNVGQKNENDNNKNRKYSVIDGRIRETYVKDSQATLHNKLYDAYVRFFRWATDRLQGRDGIICFVSNNSFVDQFAFDGMRKSLMQDFTQIYHLDLHGNIRKNPKLSGTTHNVFGIQVGVGITLAIRKSAALSKNLYYYRVPEYWRKVEKLSFLANKESIAPIEWQELQPDERFIWITESSRPEFSKFLPIGTKEAKAEHNLLAQAIFKTYSPGVLAGRDSIVYDFEKEKLATRIEQFFEAYNAEVSRWIRTKNPINIDDFVHYEKIKWSEHLKNKLKSGKYGTFDHTHIRTSIYRPFCKSWLYYDAILNDRPGSFEKVFPTQSAEMENSVIWLKIGSEWPMFALVTNVIPDYLPQGGSRCFPFYTYSLDGTNRHENITDWALAQFQAKYGPSVTKWDIFHYVYAMLHHPQYRERYAENLKRDLPHVPLLHSVEPFQTCVRIGRELMDLHLNYEQAQEYKMEWLPNNDVPFSWIVEKMRLSHDKRVVVVNESLRLGPLPPECFEYRLGNRSALEWVIDQYQVSKDARSGIESDPNRVDDQEYIIRLVCRVVTVSVETVRLVRELAGAVRMEDWMDGADSL